MNVADGETFDRWRDRVCRDAAKDVELFRGLIGRSRVPGGAHRDRPPGVIVHRRQRRAGAAVAAVATSRARASPTLTDPTDLPPDFEVIERIRANQVDVLLPSAGGTSAATGRRSRSNGPVSSPTPATGTRCTSRRSSSRAVPSGSRAGSGATTSSTRRWPSAGRVAARRSRRMRCSSSSATARATCSARRAPAARARGLRTLRVPGDRQPPTSGARTSRSRHWQVVERRLRCRAAIGADRAVPRVEGDGSSAPVVTSCRRSPTTRAIDVAVAPVDAAGARFGALVVRRARIAFDRHGARGPRGVRGGGQRVRSRSPSSVPTSSGCASSRSASRSPGTCTTR